LLKLSQTIGSALKILFFLLSLKKFFEEGCATAFGQLSFGRIWRLRLSERMSRLVPSQQKDFRMTFRMLLIVKRLFQIPAHPRRCFRSSLEIVVWTWTWACSLDCNAHHATRHGRRKELLSASIIQLRCSHSQTWCCKTGKITFRPNKEKGSYSTVFAKTWLI